LLARREHSRLELERKLLARSFPPEVVASVLDALEAGGALAAARFAESFIRSRAAKGQGPVRIRAELAQRGVNPAQTAELLRAAEIDWRAAARAARVKRFGAESPADFRERARQARFLQYRGFEHAEIDAALDLEVDSD
jgi:regulatory protein